MHSVVGEKHVDVGLYSTTKPRNQVNTLKSETLVDMYLLWVVNLRSISKKRSSRSELCTRSECFACTTKMNEVDEYMLAQPSKNAYECYRSSKLKKSGKKSVPFEKSIIEEKSNGCALMHLLVSGMSIFLMRPCFPPQSESVA